MSKKKVAGVRTSEQASLFRTGNGARNGADAASPAAKKPATELMKTVAARTTGTKNLVNINKFVDQFMRLEEPRLDIAEDRVYIFTLKI